MLIKTVKDWWNLFELCATDSEFHEYVIWFATPIPGEGDPRLLLGKKWSEAIKKKDHRTLVSMMNQAWFAGPDGHNTPRIRSFWFNLCDLCSESWVFDGEEPEEEVIQNKPDRILRLSPWGCPHEFTPKLSGDGLPVDIPEFCPQCHSPRVEIISAQPPDIDVEDIPF